MNANITNTAAAESINTAGAIAALLRHRSGDMEALAELATTFAKDIAWARATFGPQVQPVLRRVYIPDQK